MRSRIRKIFWTTTLPSAAQLEEQGFHVISYRRIRRKILKTRMGGASRSSLKNPADSILSIFTKHPKVAITDARCTELEDLQILYGYLVEPAYQKGCNLKVFADTSIEDVASLGTTDAFHDLAWDYPWTIERLVDLVERGKISQQVIIPSHVTPWGHFLKKLFPGNVKTIPPSQDTRLDQEQIAAVNAGDGIVQIIAPAGSGKTTVLIERVKKLKNRGTPAPRILCMSFNRDAMVEIGQRLDKAGVTGVEVRSFHGMGLNILKNEGLLRGDIGEIDDPAMEQIIVQATAKATTMETPDTNKNSLENAITISEARNAISEFKLASMVSPKAALANTKTGNTRDRILAQVFRLYQDELARLDRFDFDDLVARSVSFLQCNALARRRWQKKFDRVLVDEYQDIEPSQALLTGILAAPQDSLFCVGDEDQCIYAWRRATVQRIIELDQVYPGLERHALIRNYRCGRLITKASRNLVVHNKIRFRKPLHAGASIGGTIVAVTCSTRNAGAALVAYLISDAPEMGTVVLARTTRLLEEVKTCYVAKTGKMPHVELATIHASKGREWERVILYAIDEGQVPHKQALAEGGLEDERRLFYVALTRAKLRLEIICTTNKESRFLKEAKISTEQYLH